MPEQLLQESQQKIGSDFKRAVAVKMRIIDLNRGKWDGKFLETRLGEQVSRARLMATVVAKFLSEDGRFSTLTLDDSTDTMRAKTWDNIKLFEPVKIGDIVDVIGKVREYNGEIYIVPEIIRKTKDPNLELLRKLELVKRYGPVNFGNKEKVGATEIKFDIKKQVLKLIDESKDGISYSEILEKVKAPQAEIEYVINDLLSGGICWEPSPGVIKKI